jgi:hypothetical protein
MLFWEFIICPSSFFVDPLYFFIKNDRVAGNELVVTLNFNTIDGIELANVIPLYKKV